MQWSLFVLILMGQCSFCLCRLYEYHFVEEKKTWDEAQKYCRDKYTDLAKVFDMTDMKRLNDLAGNQGGAWIGLHNQNNVNRNWLWSLPGVEFNDSETEWGGGTNNQENCVMMRNYKWNDHPCNHDHPFICYDETNQNKYLLIDEGKTWLEAQSYYEVILINEKMTWEQAVTYCRVKHGGLISITNPQKQRWAEKVAKQATSTHVWTGLRFNCKEGMWFWVTGKIVCYNNWGPDYVFERCGMSGVMETSGDHKWSKKYDSMEFSFICTKR
ncbi:hypothetical protein VZT92_017280 [Zoarces viviparus]|uniref:C-type lectin domain-containing protein n=1 Tax=Zoarces viviparus TaxID=48416 RepID=A0AAW1ERL6_ZOAVI